MTKSTVPAESVLQCRELQLRRGGHDVLNLSTLQIGIHEAVAIIGPNGSGKSSLILTWMGILQPHRGAVQTQAGPMHKHSAFRRAKMFAYVPQSVSGLPELTVAAVIAGGRYVHDSGWGRDMHGSQVQIEEAITACQVADLRDRMFRTLSVGERQRVLLAAALAQDARVLVLDEPNASMDPGYEIALAKILLAWHAKRRGYILVTHNLPLVGALNARVIALRQGQIVADGTARDVLSAPSLEALFDAPFAAYARAGHATTLLPDWLA